MYERALTTDRWPNRAISPLPFDVNLDGMDVVVVHPGWGKRPEMHRDLLTELTEVGFRAIGIDTRYGYANQNTIDNTPKQRMRVGNANPFFDGLTPEQNRYFYRRPTGLLQACVDLELEAFTYIGHSEGGRIGLTAAQADRMPSRVKRMVIVNGVGTGQATGAVGMLRANMEAIKSRGRLELSNDEALRGFRDSAVHFMTHVKRTKREADVIKGYDAWADIGQLSLKLDQITIMNARDDPLISFADAEARSQEHPEVEFMPTEGSHSNIYKPDVYRRVIDELTK